MDKRYYSYQEEIVNNRCVSAESQYEGFTEEALTHCLEAHNLELLDFRPPTRGEEYIPYCWGYDVAFCNFRPDEPRFIVRKKEKQIVRNQSFTFTLKDIYGKDKIELPEGWKFRDFRKVKPNEHYLSPDLMIVGPNAGNLSYPYIIVERKN